MIDLAFPRSLPDFQRTFPDDGACARYLEGIRWRDGSGRGRVALRYIRGTASGEKYEHEEYCWIRGDYELREIARPLGFVRRRPKEEQQQNETDTANVE